MRCLSVQKVKVRVSNALRLQFDLKNFLKTKTSLETEYPTLLFSNLENYLNIANCSLVVTSCLINSNIGYSYLFKSGKNHTVKDTINNQSKFEYNFQ